MTHLYLFLSLSSVVNSERASPHVLHSEAARELAKNVQLEKLAITTRLPFASMGMSGGSIRILRCESYYNSTNSAGLSLTQFDVNHVANC